MSVPRLSLHCPSPTPVNPSAALHSHAHHHFNLNPAQVHLPALQRNPIRQRAPARHSSFTLRPSLLRAPLAWFCLPRLVCRPALFTRLPISSLQRAYQSHLEALRDLGSACGLRHCCPSDHRSSSLSPVSRIIWSGRAFVPCRFPPANTTQSTPAQHRKTSAPITCAPTPAHCPRPCRWHPALPVASRWLRAPRTRSGFSPEPWRQPYWTPTKS